MVPDDRRWLGGCISSRCTGRDHAVNIFRLLLISQFRVCRRETYRVKLLTYRVLLRYSEESGRAAQPPAAASAQGAQAGASLLRRNHRVDGYGVPYKYVLIDAMCANLIPDIYGMKIHRR